MAPPMYLLVDPIESRRAPLTREEGMAYYGIRGSVVASIGTLVPISATDELRSTRTVGITGVGAP
jgi:hypothetical protein